MVALRQRYTSLVRNNHVAWADLMLSKASEFHASHYKEQSSHVIE